MIFGMNVQDGLPDKATPIDGIAIVKYLDEEGVVSWLISSTEGLSDMEALGLLTAAQELQKAEIAANWGGEEHA